MITFETERLWLRKFSLDDLDDLYDFTKNPDVGVMQGWKPHESREEALTALKTFVNDEERWAVVLKEDGKVIGWVKTCDDNNRGKLRAKYISYVLSSHYWGNGYTTEAAKRILCYWFEDRDIDLMTAFCFPHNTRSKRVIERCGLEYEVTLKQAKTIYDGQVFDSVCYSLCKADYFSRRSY